MALSWSLVELARMGTPDELAGWYAAAWNEVDPVKRRISLGLKQTLANPWAEFAEKYPQGTEVGAPQYSLEELKALASAPVESKER